MEEREREREKDGKGRQTDDRKKRKRRVCFFMEWKETVFVTFCVTFFAFWRPFPSTIFSLYFSPLPFSLSLFLPSSIFSLSLPLLVSFTALYSSIFRRFKTFNITSLRHLTKCVCLKRRLVEWKKILSKNPLRDREREREKEEEKREREKEEERERERSKEREKASKLYHFPTSWMH